jgi:hypothetical protein
LNPSSFCKSDHMSFMILGINDKKLTDVVKISLDGGY